MSAATGALAFLGGAEGAAPLEDARFVVLPIPYEKTTSYKKGTERGPAALLEASAQVEVYDEETGAEPHRSGIHTLPPMTSDAHAEDFFPRLGKKVEELAALDGKTVFSIGGEHSLSQALIPPFAGRHDDLSVLHFDAHADLRPDYEGTPHSHACALHPIAKLCPLVQVGIRNISPDERPFVNAGKTTTFLMHEHLDVAALIPKVLEKLTGTVYLTIDLDGFDPSVIPGVGTPQPGGFLWYDALALLRAVFKARRVVGVDVMELCPLSDSVQSEFAAAKLVYRMMGWLSLKG